MPIIINNIKLKLNESKDNAIKKAINLLDIDKKNIKSIGIAKTSLDARKRTDIQTVNSVCVYLEKDETALVDSLNNPNIKYQEDFKTDFSIGDKAMEVSPYIIGFGPAGMFSALVLAKMGYKPIVLEKGLPIEQRIETVNNFWQYGVLNPNCNVQFGEGGAGTFSDGKLTTRIKDPFNSYVLKEFVKYGAPKDILYKAKPHIGTDILRGIVKAIREDIIKLGGQVLFDTALEDIKITDGKITEIKYKNQWHKAENVILAIGHSSRETFNMLNSNEVYMENKPFSVGVRIEHLQSDIDYALYGEHYKNPNLPKGEYQLSYRENNRGIYTFCMCPGGFVVPSASEENGIVTNGMSEYSRNQKNANSALVVSVDKNDFGNDWNSGIIFQKKLEQKAFAISNSYKAPCQTVGNFLNHRNGGNFEKVLPSYSLGVTNADFNEFFPKQITDLMHNGLRDFNRKIKCFAMESAVMTGVETRTSSPIRISRNDNFTSINTEDLYPCGEGAGYAGGIMSAAIDGINVATSIMKKYRPFEMLNKI